MFAVESDLPAVLFLRWGRVLRGAVSLDAGDELIGQPGGLGEAVAVAAGEDQIDGLIQAHAVADTDVERFDVVSGSDHSADNLTVVDERCS